MERGDRMKIGIHLSSFCLEWAEDIFPHIETAAHIGYDGVEFPLMEPACFNTLKAKTLLKKHKLLATCGTGLNPHTDITSPDAHIRQKGKEHLKACLQICNDLSADTLGGVLYASWGIQKDRFHIKEGIKYSQDILEELAQHAEAYGVTMALEMLNRYESSIINTVADGLDFLKNSKQRNLGLHFDSFHAHREEKNIYQALKQAGPMLKHVHFCENDRGIPATGQVRWQEIKQALNEIDYNRWITLECFTQTHCGIAQDVSIWRNIESSPLYVAQEGYNFIRAFLE